ncbi:hypothetical protein HK104_002883 [Borealophlyctis nickersoniae]|nr:hypothetical protein HK104_002883 [Borealophlyctis nickersoniae]
MATDLLPRYEQLHPPPAALIPSYLDLFAPVLPEPDSDSDVVIARQPWGANLVNYASNSLSPSQTAAVYRAIATNQTVRTLLLTGNGSGVTDNSLPVLVRSLSINTTLTSLYLGSCSLTSTGGRMLGMILRSNHTLKKLVVSDNSLLPEGFAAFAHGLKGVPPPGQQQPATQTQQQQQEPEHVSSSLTYLDMSSNMATDDGTIVISSLLSSHYFPALEELLLNTNAITDVGGLMLVRAVESHPALRKLFLQENQMGVKSLKAFNAAVKGNGRLEVVDMVLNKRVEKAGAGVRHVDRRVKWKYGHGQRPHDGLRDFFLKWGPNTF